MALLIRAHATMMLPDLPPDKLRQLATARQWAEGKGVSLAYAQTDDLASFRYVPVGVWPPGYAVLAGTFLKLGLDYVKASLLADLVGILFFFLGLFFIAKLLQPYLSPPFSVGLFLYFSVAYSPFRLIFSTDLLSLGFFISAFALMLYLIQNAAKLPKKQVYLLALVMAALAFLPSFFRFSYYPLSFALPSLMLLYGFLQVREVRGPALFSLGIPVIQNPV